MNAIFKALNDKTRREILTLLKDGDMNASEIADCFNISKPSISHHLDILKSADLVSAVKKGQFIIYSLNTSVVEELFHWIYNLKETSHEVADNKRNTVLGTDNSSDSLSEA